MSECDSAVDPNRQGQAIRPEGLCDVLFDHWRDLRDASPSPDRIPVRDQIDMLTLPTRVLPWFFLHERRSGRFRNVIAGTRVVDGLGFEPKGRYIDELMPLTVYRARRDMFNVCLEDGRPFYYRGALMEPTRRHVGYARLLLPLHGTPGGPIDMLCGLVMFFDKAGLIGSERERIDRGHRGLFDCSIYRGGDWSVWSRSAESDGTR